MKALVKFVIVLLIAATPGFSQNAKIDSLKKNLLQAKSDTSKIEALIALGWEIRESDPPKAVEYNQQSSELIETLLRQTPDKYLREWLQFAKSAVYNNYGVLNNVISSDPKKALEYHFKALSIRQSLLGSASTWIVYKSKRGLGDTYKNIGSVYSSVNADTSYMYLTKALPLLIETKDKRGVSLIYMNFGSLCVNRGDWNLALDHYYKALGIGEEIKNKRTVAIANLNIGEIYCGMGDQNADKRMEYYNKGLAYYLKGLEIATKDNNKKWMWNAVTSIESVYRAMGNLPMAKKYGIRALELAKELKFAADISKSYLYLSNDYAAEKDYKNAYTTYLEHSRIKDSISDIKLAQAVEDVQIRYNEERIRAEQELQNKIRETHLEAESKKQKMILYFVACGLAFVVVFTGFILRSLHIRKRQNIIIAEQKRIVEEKQKEILESISYAKRLQEAILPPQEFVNQYLPDNFILYKPKDLVAGDFYWAEKVNHLFFIAAADSTGHGVPGAMVSVVCSNALNRTIKEFQLTQTGKILDKTRELVLETFEKSTSEVKDGMDISLLCVDTMNKKVYWSGANNPLWYVSNNALHELKADKQPIGKTENPKAFTTHEIAYTSNSIFYLFTDGFADQFGGPKGKKYKYKQFSDFLVSNSALSMQQQAALIDREFELWKGALEQVDDVCVIGIKL